MSNVKTSKPKKVMLINANMKMGGSERVAAKTANILSEEYDVCLLVFDDSEAVFVPDCEVICIGVPAKNGIVNKVKNVFKRSHLIRKEKKKRSIDISISFGPSANLVNVLSKRNELVISEIRAYVHKKLSCVDKYVYKHSDKIVCCSKEIEKKIWTGCPIVKDKTRVIYNPYDIAEIQKQGQEQVTDYEFNSKTIISHGRLNPVKGYDNLIKAFSIVRKQIPDAKLLIIGEGSEKGKLQTLINSLNLSDSVTLLGLRKNPYAYLSKSTLFVMSSHTEGFPNSLVEAMVFLPVISTDCPSGPREILRNTYSDKSVDDIENADYGILVPSSSQSVIEDLNTQNTMLANAIIRTVESTDVLETNKKLAQKRARSFSYELYKSKLEECF